MFVRDLTLSSVGFRLFLTGRRSHAELMVSPVSTQRHGVQLLILLLGSDGGATTGSGREMPTLGKWGVFWGGRRGGGMDPVRPLRLLSCLRLARFLLC